MRQQSAGAVYNNVIDILFVEDSSPATEPVTYAEAIQQANIDDLGQDSNLIEAYIVTARMQCEGYTGIGFINRTIQAVIRNPLGNIYLPYGPIDTLLTAKDKEGEDIEVELLGVQWKQVKTVFDYATLTYTAGYSELPQVFKTAILQQVAYLYENRGDENKLGELSPVAKSLLHPFKRV